jgi:hypothetical protein
MGHQAAAQQRCRATAGVGGRECRIQRPDDLAKNAARSRPHSTEKAVWRLGLPLDFARDSDGILHGTPGPKRPSTQRLGRGTKGGHRLSCGRHRYPDAPCLGKEGLRSAQDFQRLPTMTPPDLADTWISPLLHTLRTC